MISDISRFQACKQTNKLHLHLCHYIWFMETNDSLRRYLTCSLTHPSLWPLWASPPTQPPMSLESPQIQKSLNSFWQSPGLVSRGASSSDLYAAGRIYYIEKISRRHSVTRLLPEREQSWEHWGLWAGRWPSKLRQAGWGNILSREQKWITFSLFLVSQPLRT